MLKFSERWLIALSIFVLVLGLVATTASAQDDVSPLPGIFFLTGLMCIACPIIWLIIWILIGVWVYKDAEKRGKSGVLWLIVVIILGIIGIIIWLVVRPPELPPGQQMGQQPPPPPPPRR